MGGGVRFSFEGLYVFSSLLSEGVEVFEGFRLAKCQVIGCEDLTRNVSFFLGLQADIDESVVHRSLTRAYKPLKPLLMDAGTTKSDFAVYTPKRYIKHRREPKILEHQYPCTIVYFLDEGGDQHE